jgi:hypothetical protein
MMVDAASIRHLGLQGLHFESESGRIVRREWRRAGVGFTLTTASIEMKWPYNGSVAAALSSASVASIAGHPPTRRQGRGAVRLVTGVVKAEQRVTKHAPIHARYKTTYVAESAEPRISNWFKLVAELADADPTSFIQDCGDQTSLLEKGFKTAD